MNNQTEDFIGGIQKSVSIHNSEIVDNCSSSSSGSIIVYFGHYVRLEKCILFEISNSISKFVVDSAIEMGAKDEKVSLILRKSDGKKSENQNCCYSDHFKRAI